MSLWRNKRTEAIKRLQELHFGPEGDPFESPDDLEPAPRRRWFRRTADPEELPENVIPLDNYRPADDGA